MKKSFVLIMVLIMVMAMFAGCTTEEQAMEAEAPTDAPTEAPTPEPQPEESASFVVDFEAEGVYTYQTVNFDEAFTEECYSIEAVDALDGNALKLTVKNQQEGNTWWVAGTAFAPEYSQSASFKDLEKVTFKYTSSVDYSADVQFVVQLVWKDVLTGEQVAAYQVDFPITKQAEMTRFEMPIPEDVMSDLNSVTGYYLDWFMVGLEGNADELFNPGTFAIDDLAFYGDASYTPPEIVVPAGPAPVYSVDFEDEAIFTYKTVNFDDAFTEECLTIGAVDGFSGNAATYKVKEIEAGNTWWAAGLAMDPSASVEADFTGLKRVSIDFVSSVDYSGEVQFFIQLVWKENTDEKAEVAAINVDFPITEASEVTTFEIEVPAEVAAALDAAEGEIYLDWFMTGLADNADDLFNPGSFTIDNISFYNE